jgi:hypothetical protein
VAYNCNIYKLTSDFTAVQAATLCVPPTSLVKDIFCAKNFDEYSAAKSMLYPEFLKAICEHPLLFLGKADKRDAEAFSKILYGYYSYTKS